MNRIDEVAPLMGANPNRNMQLLLYKLTPSTILPEQDKYYVFVYEAKTPNIQYDRHPFVVCSTIWKWGFIGFNFHWNEYRKYTWKEIRSNLYEIYSEELNTMENLPIAKFVRS